MLKIGNDFSRKSYQYIKSAPESCYASLYGTTTYWNPILVENHGITELAPVGDNMGIAAKLAQYQSLIRMKKKSEKNSIVMKLLCFYDEIGDWLTTEPHIKTVALS